MYRTAPKLNYRPRPDHKVWTWEVQQPPRARIGRVLWHTGSARVVTAQGEDDLFFSLWETFGKHRPSVWASLEGTHPKIKNKRPLTLVRRLLGWFKRRNRR